MSTENSDNQEGQNTTHNPHLNQNANAQQFNSAAHPIPEIPKRDPNQCFKIEISEDKMQAVLRVNAHNMEFSGINQNFIFNYLMNTKLDQAITDFAVVPKIVEHLKKIQKGEEPNPIFSIIVSKGIKPVPGLDGWIKFYHPHNQRVVIKDDGKADFRNIDKYISIKKGEKIATVFQGVPGKPGKDVFGTDIPSTPIKRPKITIGTNIDSQDRTLPEEKDKVYTEFWATCDGALYSTDESVSVAVELTIPGDVGLESGNINYDGSIVVTGSIQEGSQLTCTGNLLVKENVESDLVNVGKDLIVKAGIKLKTKATIHVAGSLRAKFVENAILEVDGDVIIEGSVINSKIFCLGSVLLGGQTSALISSEVIVYGGFSTYNLGSNAGLAVVVTLGEHHKNEKRFVEIQNQIKTVEKELSNIIPQVQQLQNFIKQSRGKIDEVRKNKFKELVNLYQQRKKLHELLVAKFEELKTTRFNQDKMNMVVRGTAFPGAIIKYRRQVEKISVNQTSFMMTFQPGQDKANMTAVSRKDSKSSTMVRPAI